MPRKHQFGGDWTAQKLERVRKYLSAYTTIFTRNERARHFSTTYVDAFAGTGHHVPSKTEEHATLLLPEISVDPEALEFRKGSATIALEVEPQFDRYLFIEQDAEKAVELEGLRRGHDGRAAQIEIVTGDANHALRRFAAETDWGRNRAVVFLDPYGMAVDWSTIQTLGATKGVDLWVLFPLGQAVNRLLMRNEVPTGGWADALTRCFGSEEWRTLFYQTSRQLDLLSETETVQKVADFTTISEHFKARLRTCFAGVAENSLRLTNSRNVPLFLLCFASANEKGAKTAIKIANDLLKDE